MATEQKVRDSLAEGKRVERTCSDGIVRVHLPSIAYVRFDASNLNGAALCFVVPIYFGS